MVEESESRLFEIDTMRCMTFGRYNQSYGEVAGNQVFSHGLVALKRDCPHMSIK
jgi:hypothetical protein